MRGTEHERFWGQGDNGNGMGGAEKEGGEQKEMAKSVLVAPLVFAKVDDYAEPKIRCLTEQHPTG